MRNFKDKFKSVIIFIAIATFLIVARAFSVSAAEKEEDVKISFQASDESQLYIQKQQQEAARRHKEEIERLQKILREAQKRVQKWEGPIEKEYEEKQQEEQIKQKQEIQRRQEERIRLEQERKRLQEERKLAEEKRLKEEEKRKEELKLKQELKLKIDNLYKQARDLYFKNQFDEATDLFNQILSIDPTQKEATDYLTRKIPAKQAQIEEQKKKEQEERVRLEQEKQRIEEERIRLEQERKRLQEERKLAEEKRLKEEEVCNLYAQAKFLFYSDQLKEAKVLFNQILALDPTQKEANDYITTKIPQRQIEIERQNQIEEEERLRLEALRREHEEEIQRRQEERIRL
ncbi:MAG: hypothetical protein NC828_02640, partial [Candidatus Omnitrophica bacterium]|nr:hypothetical protein [Candidatus Omnitrophota bacterium]